MIGHSKIIGLARLCHHVANIHELALATVDGIHNLIANQIRNDTSENASHAEQWGIFNKDVERIDIKTASYEEIISFIVENSKTETFNFNAEEMAILR